MEMFILIIIFILGLCLGSFVNMLVYRTAVKYKLRKTGFIKTSKNRNRSFCDYCGKQLYWYENIPVISWVIQKGKSRCCHKKLSILYPIVELITGTMLLLIINRFDLFSNHFSLTIEILQLFWLLVIVTLLVFLTVFDFKYLILPDFAIFTLIVISFLGVAFDEPQILPYLLSAIGSFIFFGSIYFFTKGKGIGFGDAKLAIFMGLFLGWPKIVMAIYIAFIFGAMVAIIGMILKKVTRKSQIAFGPFLILGTIIAWFWGDQIINFLMSNF